MLTQKTIDIVKSTVPVLEAHGSTITTRFYEMMFKNHPELLNIFNHANQKQGRQQQALANAVYAAAKHIDNLEAILPVVNQIGEKHRSLGIKKEHYPIVGKHLLLAIKDVLGPAATDDIINAWEEAYGVIANVFISVERDMYNKAESQRGGWQNFRNFIVVKKEKESDVITSFYLQPEDKQPIASFLPGQFVSVKVTIPGEEYTHIRQYSLSDAPNSEGYRISVRREARDGKPDGKVSTHLHDNVEEGSILALSAPAGEFTLDEESQLPVVFISGGVGITPLMSMFNTLIKNNSKRDITFIHAAQNGNFHAMRAHVEEMAHQNENVQAFTCYEKPLENDRSDKEGYIDLPWLNQVVQTKEAQFYFCGPVPFMRTVKFALEDLGVSSENIFYEFFGPALELKREKQLV